MTIAYFDCFGGIAGDMALAALVDAGGDPSVIEAAVEALGLSGEVRVRAAREHRGHLGGTRVTLDISDRGSRTLPELETVVIEAGLPDGVRDQTLAALRRLGAAESELHAFPPAELHLHELGGADTLVDLAGAFWLLDSLGVDRVYASPLPYPASGSRTSGGLPLPAPASMRVLAGTGATLEPRPAERELVTPTGAAMLAACATFERPSMSLDRIGYGFGDNPDPANAVAVWIGAGALSGDVVDELATNLDDMAPNDLAVLAERLMEGGALDVAVTPIVMKKGRPGHLLTVLSSPALTGELTQLMLRHSPTLGLRVTRTPRVIAEREVIEVESSVGRARVKVKRAGGQVEVAAEHDDVKLLASKADAPLGEVRRIIEEAARLQLGLER
ncbi:MAG TPA: nickel pincer cofactor biosynthesis protein LarC [Candidatus Dormibacteraeota bacterium]